MSKLRQALEGGCSSVTLLQKQTGCRHSTAKWFLAMEECGFRCDEDDFISERKAIDLKNDIEGFVNGNTNPFFTATEIAREIRGTGRRVSRKRVAKFLKSFGFRYQNIRSTRWSKKRHLTSAKGHLKVVLYSIISALEDDDTAICFLDETKFQLTSCPQKAWLRKKMPVPKRDEVEAKLVTAISSCTIDGFNGVQIFEGEVRAQDYMYFVANLLEKLAKSGYQKIVLLQDGPKWHTADIIKRSYLWRYLLTNIKGYWDLNIIENAFSSVKQLFGRRPKTTNMEEELKYIVGSFSKANDAMAFQGFTRNLLRSMVRRLPELVIFNKKD